MMASLLQSQPATRTRTRVTPRLLENHPPSLLQRAPRAIVEHRFQTMDPASTSSLQVSVSNQHGLRMYRRLPRIERSQEPRWLVLMSPGQLLSSGAKTCPLRLQMWPALSKILTSLERSQIQERAHPTGFCTLDPQTSSQPPR